jgi:hypothetical protein
MENNDDNDDDVSNAVVDFDNLEIERRAFDPEREGFSLVRAAALLPRVEGRGVDVAAVDQSIDGYARQDAERVERAGAVEALFDGLFATAGFRGPEVDYDAPTHSFLDDVLARKRGLPIALSLIVVETATRAGLQAWGLALPGHFLAGVFVSDQHFAVMDAFVAAGGNFIDTADIYSRWAEGNPGGVSEEIIGRWMKDRGNRRQDHTQQYGHAHAHGEVRQRHRMGETDAQRGQHPGRPEQSS